MLQKPEMTLSVSSAMKRNNDDDDLLVLKKITFFHLLSLPTVPWFFLLIQRQQRVQHERLKGEFRESISRYYSVQNVSCNSL